MKAESFGYTSFTPQRAENTSKSLSQAITKSKYSMG
jgi:hypothetical protein